MSYGSRRKLLHLLFPVCDLHLYQVDYNLFEVRILLKTLFDYLCFHQMVSDLQFPRNCSEIQGQDAAVTQLRAFIQSYKPGMSCVLVYGPIGCGKSCSYLQIT